MDSISIKGASNVAKLVESLSSLEVQILISVDDFQAHKEAEERHFMVEVVYPQYSGEQFTKVTE